MGHQQGYNRRIRVFVHENVGADVLSKLGSTRAAVPPRVFVHELHHPSVKEQSQQATNTELSATVREVLMIDEDW